MAAQNNVPWCNVLLAVLLLCTEIDNINSLQCHGDLKNFPPHRCTATPQGTRQCYNLWACLNGSSNRTHTCVNNDQCPPMKEDNTAKAYCSVKLTENKRVHGCSASFKSPMPLEYRIGATMYKCQIDMSAIHSIKCTCYGESASMGVVCSDLAGYKKLAQCVNPSDDHRFSNSLGCSVTIPDTMLLSHASIYDDKNKNIVHNLKKCTDTFVRVSADGGPDPKSLDSNKVWCCTGQGIVCDHICYNNAMSKYEVCPRGKEKCYYAKGNSVNDFTSGCSDGKEKNTVILNEQKDIMQCWKKQVATHYICVKFNGNVNTYDHVNKVSSDKFVKEALVHCAEALHTTVNVHCIHLPILLPGKDTHVQCAIAMHEDKCDENNKELQAEQKLCWKYDMDAATLKNEAKRSARMSICDKCSGLFVNSKQKPGHFWSSCKNNKPPAGFVKAPKHTQYMHPNTVASHVEQCGQTNLFCWNNYSISCIWWQKSNKAQLGCIDDFTKVVGNHINLDKTCMDKVHYAVDKDSGRYIKWQCCDHSTCDKSPLDNVCPMQVTTAFTKQDLCSRHTVTTTKPKTYKYTEVKSSMVQCNDKDPCSQGVKWDGGNEAMLAVNCQSQIPSDVPPECSDKAIAKPPNWPTGAAVGKLSHSVDVSVLHLAQCITNVTCTSVTVSSTETAHTGTVTPLPLHKDDTEPPQCTAEAASGYKGNLTIHLIAFFLAALLRM